MVQADVFKGMGGGGGGGGLALSPFNLFKVYHFYI